MSYFYGPVPSRRLGFSLGVDLIPKKTCTLDCLYCQLGCSEKKTMKRFFYVDMRKFTQELKEITKTNPKIDYITISGSGEPTLHKSLDKIIRAIKKIVKNKYPVCVITNSSLLYRKDVRNELKAADLIIPSLDAATSGTFRRINRPHKAVVFKKLIKGIISLRKEFKGKIWLEIMLIAGVNDTIAELEKFREIAKNINPDKVQLNLPVRPCCFKLSGPSPKKLERIVEIINSNAEIVAGVSNLKNRAKVSKDLAREILTFLKRRPATLDDLVISLAAKSRDISKELNFLLDKGVLRKQNNHFTIND